jgi:hypothetical protein
MPIIAANTADSRASVSSRRSWLLLVIAPAMAAASDDSKVAMSAGRWRPLVVVVGDTSRHNGGLNGAPSPMAGGGEV